MSTTPIKGTVLPILLVEDNPDHAELLIRSLEKQQVANKIHHVTDGEAALDYLYHRGEFIDPNNSPSPHLVLLDLRLPKIDGLSVLKQIKEDPGLCKTPVVILTTSNAEMDAAKAYEYHANSYLVKPLDFKRFTEMMTDLGRYWLGWNHYPWA